MADSVAVPLLAIWAGDIAFGAQDAWIHMLTITSSPAAFFICRLGFGLGGTNWTRWFAALGIGWIAALPMVAIIRG